MHKSLLKKNTKIILTGFLTALLLTGLPAESPAQQKVVHAQAVWLQKTLDIGDTVSLKILVTRPAMASVSIPDTFKAFKPYEILSTGKILTQDMGDQVVDETIFKVRSFKVDSVQEIRLPIRIVYDDKTMYDSTTADRIRFNPRIRLLTDDLQYFRQMTLAEVRSPADRRLMYLILGIGLPVLALIGYFLRKPAARWWKKRKLTADWKKMRAQLQSQRPVLTSEAGKAVEEINLIWKNYLQLAVPETYLNLRSRTSTEIDEALVTLPDLSPESVTVLSEWCRAEETILYAGQSYGKEQLNHLLNRLIHILETEFIRRKRAIR